MKHPCPKCGGTHLHHSRLRNLLERVRWRFTGRVPFRCHACNWRGWRDDVHHTKELPRPDTRELTDSQLATLDGPHDRGDEGR